MNNNKSLALSVALCAIACVIMSISNASQSTKIKDLQSRVTQLEKETQLLNRESIGRFNNLNNKIENNNEEKEETK